MTNTISNGSKPTTFEQAEELAAYSLAVLWAEQNVLADTRPFDRDRRIGRARVHVSPGSLARSVAGDPDSSSDSAGAEPEAAAAAFGGSVAQAFECWHDWAAEQRNSVICGRPGVTAEDYATVATAFVAAGATTPGEKPERD